MGGIQLRANPAQPSSTRSFSILRPAACKPVGCLHSFLCFAKKSPTGGPVGPTGRLETALPVGDWKSPLRASGMIPRETGRGLSISGAHRVAAVERLVGATLVVALPRTAPPSAGHCLGTTQPGGWSGDSIGERCDPAGHPQGVPLRSSGIGSLKEEVTYNLRYENYNLTTG